MTRSTNAKRRLWLATTACAGFALVGANAHAQSASASSTEINISPIQQIGQTLADKGIYLNASYFGEFAGNPTGGAAQGSDYADQVAAGADVDLQKLVGWQGGALHIEFTNRDGNNQAADVINNSVATQQIFGGGQTYYLTTLTLEQKLFNGLVDITAGRTELDQLTLHDPIYCHFQSNAVCGQPDIMGKIINASFWPVAVWAGQVIVNPVKDWYFKAGIADHDPGDSAPPHHGFNWGLSQSDGFELPLEIDYQTSFADDAFPRRYDVGVVFDRTPYSFAQFDPATNTLGSQNAYGRSMVYVQAKQMVYRPDMNSHRGLTLFGAAIFGPNGNQEANYNITAGGVYQGPFASRPADSAGFFIGDTHYRDSFIDQLADFRHNVLGGTQRPASSLIMMEVDYDAFLTPWLDVMPNFQYIVNPDGLGNRAYPQSNLPNAFVIGLQFNVNISGLVGLPAQS